VASEIKTHQTDIQNHPTIQHITMAESIQYERDLRSANKEWRRTKDSAAKWAHGSRHLAGITSFGPGHVMNGATAPEHMFAKCRPEKKPSQWPKSWHTCEVDRCDHVPTQHRVKMHAHAEIEDAASALADLPSPTGPSLSRTLSASADAGVLYSYDRADTPGSRPPLTLEVFVVKNNGAGAAKETERLVEREYEVLDGNGEAVRGKRARAVLRRGGTAAAAGGGGDEVEVEGGFELV